jgi:hypothetical protein
MGQAQRPQLRLSAAGIFAAQRASVLNGTVLISRICHHSHMSHRKDGKQSYQAVLAAVKKEMAQPRFAKSARIEAEKLSKLTLHRTTGVIGAAKP